MNTRFDIRVWQFRGQKLLRRFAIDGKAMISYPAIDIIDIARGHDDIFVFLYDDCDWAIDAIYHEPHKITVSTIFFHQGDYQVFSNFLQIVDVEKYAGRWFEKDYRLNGWDGIWMGRHLARYRNGTWEFKDIHRNCSQSEIKTIFKWMKA